MMMIMFRICLFTNEHLSYIVYDLGNWPKISLKSFTLKNCFFGTTNSVKNSDKDKYVYSGSGIGFDGKGEW